MEKRGTEKERTVTDQGKAKGRKNRERRIERDEVREGRDDNENHSTARPIIN